MSNSLRKISNLAYQILRKLNIFESEIDVENVARKLGVEIIEYPFADDISGVLAIKNGNPTIGVNVGHSRNRKRFSIAHELGHYVLKHERNGLFIDDHKKHFSGALLFRNNESSTGEKRQEREANAFAAALLMPEEMIKERLTVLQRTDYFDLSGNENNSNNIIQKLASEFGVSEQAMSFRLLNLNKSLLV